MRHWVAYPIDDAMGGSWITLGAPHVISASSAEIGNNLPVPQKYFRIGLAMFFASPARPALSNGIHQHRVANTV
jgi:hypothetical protein